MVAYSGSLGDNYGTVLSISLGDDVGIVLGSILGVSLERLCTKEATAMVLSLV